MMVRIRSLDVLLSAMENGLGGEELGEDAPDGPDVWKHWGRKA